MLNVKDLGYADIIELREQLVHTNVAFASEISDMQEGISNSLCKLLDIIARMKNYEYNPSDVVQITLVPPIVLILQLVEMTLSSIGNISGVFQTLQIPTDPYYLLEQYVPHIDWEKFKEKATNYQTKIKTKADIDNASTGLNFDPNQQPQ